MEAFSVITETELGGGGCVFGALDSEFSGRQIPTVVSHTTKNYFTQNVKSFPVKKQCSLHRFSYSFLKFLLYAFPSPLPRMPFSYFPNVLPYPLRPIECHFSESPP